MSDVVKPSLPAPDGRFEREVKETLEIIMGRRGNRIKPLDTTATQAQIIEKVNELLKLLQ